MLSSAVTMKGTQIEKKSNLGHSPSGHFKIHLYYIPIFGGTMKSLVLVAMLALVGNTAFANYALVQKGGDIWCYADDDQSIFMGSERKNIQYEVEGESRGPLPINVFADNGKTSASFSTEELTLTLSDQGDTVDFGSGPEEWRCQ
jgi:hypothetical protein